MSWLRAHLPGLLIVAAVAGVARVVGGYLPKTISEVLVAIVLGMVLANLLPLPAATKTGTKFAVQKLLRAGIVLLGARLSLQDLVATGLPAVAVVAVLMAVALAFTLGVGHLLGLPRRLCLLIGVGTAVCGNTAIIATAPVVQAEEREVGFAVATITLMGTLAVLLYPTIGHALDMAPALYGAWAGVAVNDTSQVVAAGAAYGEEALQTATVVKMVRNTLMAPLIVGIAFAFGRGAGAAKAGAKGAFPLFVLGFLGMAALNSTGLIPKDVARWCTQAASVLILCALAGVGLSTLVRDLMKNGVKPLLLGVGASILTATLGLVLVRAVLG
jgi:uncharacterized integral membrane protein (TIGR00698 family)